MLGVFKKKNAREEELRKEEEDKKKKDEEMKGENGSTGEAEEVKGPARVRVSPGEIRFKKDLLELDLPPHAETNFPDSNNIMKFEVFVDLTKEVCYWKGGKFKFTITVPPNYPHEAPKCHCDT